MTDFKEGDRVTLSELYKQKRGGRYKTWNDRVGTIKKGKHGQLYVVWDGFKTRHPYHHTFIARVSQKENDNATS